MSLTEKVETKRSNALKFEELIQAISDHYKHRENCIWVEGQHCPDCQRLVNIEIKARTEYQEAIKQLIG